MANHNKQDDIAINIIYLMADDQNVSSVGCYGNNEVSTPNMDKIGNQGIKFTRHYNTTAICMASRASVFTGMYEYKTGTNFEHGNMLIITLINDSAFIHNHDSVTMLSKNFLLRGSQ